MKNKGLVKKALFLPDSWNQLGSFRSAPTQWAVGCDIRSAIHLLVLAAVLLVSLPASLLYAEESGALLENISFDRQSSSRETVSFKLNGPHIPKIFAMKGDTPKVIFDFYDTRHSTSIKGVMKSKGNLISAIRIGMHTDPQLKTRVVLDLVAVADYDFDQEFREKDNTLIITIFTARQKQKKDKQQGVQAGATSKKSDRVPAKATPPLGTVENKSAPRQQVPEEKVEPLPVTPAVVAVKNPSVPSSSQLVITAISIEKTPDKGEKVSFNLTNFHPPVVFGIEEGTPSIVCDFMGGSIGNQVPEIIAANGEFIKQVRVEKNVDLNKTRVVLDLVPNRHYDLQQIFYKEENLYVIFVNSADSAGAGGSGRP